MPDSRRPEQVMHTYFSNTVIGGDTAAGHNETLRVWSEWWRAAGFEPVILSESDARQHPAYASLRKLYLTLPTVNNPEYELACFMRHLAMAAVGGGWLSDYDTVPLRMRAPAAFDAAYTVHGGFVPALVSGSATEWERVAWLLGRVPWQQNQANFSVMRRGQRAPHVSDMLSMRFLADSAAVHANSCGVLDAAHIFGPERPLPMTLQCKAAQCARLPFAVHFSHSAVSRLTRQVGAARPQRAWLMNATLAEYTQACFPEAVPTRIWFGREPRKSQPSEHITGHHSAHASKQTQNPMSSCAAVPIVEIKTHKTGSSAIASMIFHYGARRGLRFAFHESHYLSIAAGPAAAGAPSKLSLYHHTFSGTRAHWSTLFEYYNQLVPDARFIVPVRRPDTRTWSDKPSLSADLGIKSAAELTSFVESTAGAAVIWWPMERFEDAALLVVSKGIFSLVDAASAHVNAVIGSENRASDPNYAAAWGNKSIDTLIYEHALRRFEAEFARLDVGWLATRRKALAVLNGRIRCEGAVPYQGKFPSDICRTYLMLDMEYWRNGSWADEKKWTGFNGLIRKGDGIVDASQLTMLQPGPFDGCLTVGA